MIQELNKPNQVFKSLLFLNYINKPRPVCFRTKEKSHTSDIRWYCWAIVLLEKPLNLVYPDEGHGPKLFMFLAV